MQQHGTAFIWLNTRIGREGGPNEDRFHAESTPRWTAVTPARNSHNNPQHSAPTWIRSGTTDTLICSSIRVILLQIHYDTKVRRPRGSKLWHHQFASFCSRCTMIRRARSSKFWHQFASFNSRCTVIQSARGYKSWHQFASFCSRCTINVLCHKGHASPTFLIRVILLQMYYDTKST